MIKKEYILSVASRLKAVSPDLSDGGYSDTADPPAVKVINSVISQGLSSKYVVYPRLEGFKEKRPDIKSVKQLADLMASYTTPLEFLTEEVDLKNKLKAGAINGIVKYLCDLIEASPTVPEEETLKQWAITAEPDDHKKLKIKGVGIATLQWLRILLGADTSKPDVHIMNFINDTIGQKLSEDECILLIESVASYLEVSERDVDGAIWEFMASRSRTVRLAPDVADAFPTDTSVNEALRSLLKSSQEVQETTFVDVCLDFDGVLHSYDTEWQDAAIIPDPPVDGAIAAVYGYLDAGLTLAILSVRSSLPGGIQAMREWLDKHDAEYRYQNKIHHDVPLLTARIYMPDHKPAAKLYVDDRGFRFEGTFPTPDELQALYTPWNKPRKR